MIITLSRKLLPLTFLVLACISFPASFSAAETETAPFTLMDSREFKLAMENPAGNPVILDARPVERFLDGHIKGALNIFAPDLEKDPSLLKADKQDRILVYCDGVKCNPETGKTASGFPCRSMEAILPTKSGKAAMTVVKQGYTDVAVLYEGFPGWDLKGFEAYAGKDDGKRLEMPVIKASELKKISEAKNGDDKIIDLRLPSEFAEGHIPGAVNMPFAVFTVNSGSLDRSKRIIVYSGNAVQGHNAVRRLQKLGFAKVARADYLEWVAAGFPLAKK